MAVSEKQRARGEHGRWSYWDRRAQTLWRRSRTVNGTWPTQT